METITPELVLAAYAEGYFPMGDARHDEALRWYAPDPRAIIPLDAFHVPRSLAKLIRKRPFTVTTDKAFRDVITACANREETWINDRIIELYCALHTMGFAHSVECWQGDTLAGGLYGVALGSAFFGESMFTAVPNASRVALVHLVEMLRECGYKLLDTQFVNHHLQQFGVVEISRNDYLVKLDRAIHTPPGAAWKAGELYA
jgi:leucyl/phenylalanyl-tRNA--protein transferase